MPETMTRPALTCEMCPATLTGGRDTFGGVGETLCLTCHMEMERREDEQLAAHIDDTHACRDCGRWFEAGRMFVADENRYHLLCRPCFRARVKAAAK